MKVYVAYDGNLRVRIGQENLGSASLGPWYGGTGAIRLRQVHNTWFFVYQLDDHAPRGTSALSETAFERVREHLPSARLVRPICGFRRSQPWIPTQTSHLFRLKPAMDSDGSQPGWRCGLKAGSFGA
jgi:hypothetical protein